MRITKCIAREILDSRGFPTVEVDLYGEHPKNPSEHVFGRAAVPSGASTGDGEALELRDGDAKRYIGKGVLTAVGNVNDKIASQIVKQEYLDQRSFDNTLLDLDGTNNKRKLGANAILACSMAFARIKAEIEKRPLFQSLSDVYKAHGTGSFECGVTLPVPLMNVINGGKHADNGLGIQEFMIVPAGFARFSDSFRAGVEVFHHLKKILHHKHLSTSVGDEGGFAPVFKGENQHEQALELLMQAIHEAGYEAGKHVFLALDVASSELVDKTANQNSAIHYMFEGKKITSEQLGDIYQGWLKKFPIVSIEDGHSEHDWAGWRAFTQTAGRKCQLVGDDLFVTNVEFLKKGINEKSANSILIKLNQIGSVTETLQTMALARESGYSAIVSHRSGETEDSFIADLAVATGAGQIKTGSASRTDRMAKYNQLLRIEETLGAKAQFAGLRALQR